MQYFEDYEVGQKSAFGSYHVTREEIIEFASKYDPQPFHLSDEGAAGTHFGKLAASGWHTGAMCMAMLVENMKERQHASLGSPGLDQLLWKKPVHAGDTLRVETEMIEKRRSQSRPEIGITKNRIQVLNQDDEVVMQSINVGLVMVRDPEAPIED
ncbi:MAG: MaoC family dehydratase [Erythrobacter sp.]|nr:MaoC family dehydratase [Erythrobacter sp.]